LYSGEPFSYISCLNKFFAAGSFNTRKLLRTVPRQITTVLNADVLWEMGITGAGVKVLVTFFRWLILNVLQTRSFA
jgi:hypothetical protein